MGVNRSRSTCRLSGAPDDFQWFGVVEGLERRRDRVVCRDGRRKHGEERNVQVEPEVFALEEQGWDLGMIRS